MHINVVNNSREFHKEILNYFWETAVFVVNLWHVLSPDPEQQIILISNELMLSAAPHMSSVYDEMLWLTACRNCRRVYAWVSYRCRHVFMRLSLTTLAFLDLTALQILYVSFRLNSLIQVAVNSVHKSTSILNLNVFQRNSTCLLHLVVNMTEWF